jgi:hypothetical protein
MTRLLSMLLLLMCANVSVADGPNGPGANSDVWWTERESGWLGGLVGGSVGILAAVLGVTAGLGKARSFVMALAAVLFGTGVVLLGIGATAVGTGQPYHVYFLFFVIGGVLALVMGLNYPNLKRRFDQLEFQRMKSMDA